MSQPHTHVVEGEPLIPARVSSASVSWISPPRPGGVWVSTPKMAGSHTYRPMTIQLLGADPGTGFSTRSVTLTTSASLVGEIAALPYCETCSGSTSISATTLPPKRSRTSIILVSRGSRLSMRSSPSRTANGSSPTCRSAHSTAWPSPFGSPWRT